MSGGLFIRSSESSVRGTVVRKEEGGTRDGWPPQEHRGGGWVDLGRKAPRSVLSWEAAHDHTADCPTSVFLRSEGS